MDARVKPAHDIGEILRQQMDAWVTSASYTLGRTK